MRTTEPRRALVLGGGGILGAAYEVGLLAAIEERFGEGAIYRSFDLFVGTSAGSFVTALVGQGIPPGRILRAMREHDASLFVRPEDVYRLDVVRLVKGAARFIWAVAREAVRALLRHEDPPVLDLFAAGLDHLPVGFLRIDPLERKVRDILAREGLSNGFDAIPKPILIPAVDLDRGERRIFGSDPIRDPPISVAVTASSAIPRLFGPIRIGSRFYVDGGVGGAADLDVALEGGATSILFVNPIVATRFEIPLDETVSVRESRIVKKGGLGAVLDQCSKLEQEAAVAAVVQATRAFHPDVELVVVQPRREESLLESAMDYSAHRGVLERGFRGLDSAAPDVIQGLGRFFESRFPRSIARSGEAPAEEAPNRVVDSDLERLAS